MPTPEPTGGTPAGFYDDLAASFDRVYPDWEASFRRQGDALHAVIRGELGPGWRWILDCAAGIGTQLLGLDAHGHRLAGSDLSTVALRRARAECDRRGVRAALVAADMRALPFADASFEVVVCADNSLPHLLTADGVVQALAEMRRVVSPGGLALVSTRDYDRLRAERPPVTPPQLSHHGGEATVTFQLWDWRPDGERYDMRLFQVTGEGERWRLAQRRTVYWALTRAQLSGFAAQAGLATPEWRLPDETGFFQPLLLARAP
jgi:glycine/sarcosine N-methyltransferase